MPDLKITELPTSTVADNDDIMTFVDVSQADPSLKNRKITTENYLAGRLKIKKLPITGNYTIPADIFDDGTDIVVFNISGSSGPFLVTVDSGFNNYNRLKGFEIRITSDSVGYEVDFTNWASVTGSYTSGFAAGPAYPTILVLAGYSAIPRIVNYNSKSFDTVRDNTANIATNTANIATNTGNISTNTTNIATNATNIATNVTNISTNATNIAQNVLDIEANALAIEKAPTESVISIEYGETIFDAAIGDAEDQGAIIGGNPLQFLREAVTIDGIDTFRYKLNGVGTDTVSCRMDLTADDFSNIYDYGGTYKLTGFSIDIDAGLQGCNVQIICKASDQPPQSGVTDNLKYLVAVQANGQGFLTLDGFVTSQKANEPFDLEMLMPSAYGNAILLINGVDVGAPTLPFLPTTGSPNTGANWFTGSANPGIDRVTSLTKIGLTVLKEGNTRQILNTEIDDFDIVKIVTPPIVNDFTFLLPAMLAGANVGRTISVVANNKGGTIFLNNTDVPPTFFVIRDGISVPDQILPIVQTGVTELLNTVDGANTYSILSNNISDVNEGAPQYTYNHTLTAFINVTLPATGSEYIVNFKDGTGTGMFVDGSTEATTQEPTPLNPYLEVINGTDLLVLRDVPKGFVALLEVRLNKTGGVASQISVFIRTSDDGITYIDRPDSLRTTVVSNDGDVTFAAGLTDLAGFSAGTYIRIGLQNSGAGTLVVTTPPPITTSLGTVNGYAIKFSLQLDV